MDRAPWIKNVLDVVAQFASEEFQRSAWVEFNGPDGASFEEACELLDDFRLKEVLMESSGKIHLETGERKILSKFVQALNDYSKNIYETRVKKPSQDYAAPSQIISQPEWQKVRDAALSVLIFFKKSGFPTMPRLPIFDRSTITMLTRKIRQAA